MESLTSWILNSQLKTIISIILIVLFIYYIYHRAGSGYSLFSRIWNLISGEKNFNHSDLQSLVHDRNDIERYNVVFNGRATSIKQIKKFKIWYEKYDISLKEISNAKGWFDIDRLKITTPTWPVYVFVPFFCVSTLILTLFFTTLGVRNSAALTFKSDNSTFWIDSHSAKNIFPYYLPFTKNSLNWEITPEQCRKYPEPTARFKAASGMNDEQVKIICASFTSAKQQLFIKETIRKQKYLLFFAAGLLFFLIFLIVKLSRILSSYDARNMIRRKVHEYMTQRSL